ncbi:MAG: amidohydrolase [Veillonellaceae bacterium]|nr:amidohydrolase [Veillonellaceae bacterium]
MDSLIKNGYVFLPDGSYAKKDIAVKDGRIAAVGDIPDDFKAEETIDASDMFIVPGFVNAHTHASMTLLRSYADDMMLQDWLTKKIWPTEANMVSDDIYWGAALAAVEMIKGGTTCFADMYGPYMERVAEVVNQSGMRAVLSRGMIGINPNGEKALQENVSLFNDWNGAADGRITVMFAPHAPYTCPPDFLKKINSVAEKLGAEIHIHMSETKQEVEDMQKQYGKRPFKLVEDTGIFERGALAAHCVWLDEEDISIIRKHHIRVAHNPGSNMKLASGAAPIPRLLKDGVCVALGTDGASSNNNLDMLEEVRLAALLHKTFLLDPLAVPAAEALKMGTEYGSDAVGVKDSGRIEAGYKADLVMYSMNAAEWYPRNDLVSLLIYAANSSSVDTVMVDGKLIMQKRHILTLDEERIKYEANRCAMKLTGKA